MKKLLSTIIILVLMYAIYQVGVKFFGPGHIATYSIHSGDQIFEVTEEFNNSLGTYVFDVLIEDNNFEFAIYEDFFKADVVVEDFQYYSDDAISCLLPVFDGDTILMDFICYDGAKYGFYHNEFSDAEGIKNFIGTMDYETYNLKTYQDNKQSDINYGSLEGVKDNLVSDHLLWLADYRGVYIANDVTAKSIYRSELFSNDHYEKELEIGVGDYFLVADYDKENYFTDFRLVDLVTNGTSTIESREDISFDSYIQGKFDGSVYLVDREENRQLQINTRTKKVIEVGNPETGMVILKNGSMERVADETLFDNDVLFEDKQLEQDGEYTKFISTGNNEEGYTYYYQKENDIYYVYRSLNKSGEKIFLFTTDKVENIVLGKSFIIS